MSAPKLSIRARREWAKKLGAAQEAVEAAEEARNRLMAEAYTSGVSYAGIETATGIGPQTVRNCIDGADAG